MRSRQFLAPAIFAIAVVVCSATSISTPGPVAVLASQTQAEAPVQLPNRDGSLKFAVFGDFGTASRQQHELATQMQKLHQKFPFELVLLAGDNLYGSERPQDFTRKFEIPYKPLLEAKVKF